MDNLINNSILILIISVISVLSILCNIVILLFLKKAKSKHSKLESEFKKVRHDLSLKSVGLLDKLEKLTEENQVLKSGQIPKLSKSI